MGKKSKNNQPNAPDLHQVLLDSPLGRQPPNNPYYPDLGSEARTLPPPPYSDLSTPPQNSYSHPGSACIQYSRMSRSGVPRETAVHIPQPMPRGYPRGHEKYHRNVRKFNFHMLLIALLAIGLSLYAHSLFSRRICIGGVLVHKPAKDVSISMQDIEDGQLHIAYISVFILLICVAKSVCGESNGYSCYLFLMAIGTLILTMTSGALAYYAFYTPCTARSQVEGGFKTILGQVFDTIPAPDKGVFGEKNVFQTLEQDKEGFWIFWIDFLNFIFYLSGFITSLSLCR